MSMSLGSSLLAFQLGLIALRFTEVVQSKILRIVRLTTVNRIVGLRRQLGLISRKNAVIANNSNGNATMPRFNLFVFHPV